jgi:hypothetical protein
MLLMDRIQNKFFSCYCPALVGNGVGSLDLAFPIYVQAVLSANYKVGFLGLLVFIHDRAKLPQGIFLSFLERLQTRVY